MKTGFQLLRCAFALALCSLAMGCGSSRSTSHPLPCSEVPGTTCGSACTSNATCGTGLYCSGAGTCEANCVPGGTSCGTGKSCDSTGHCVSDSVVCPPGLTCNTSCSGGTSTTITGKVYDPAGKNGLYNITVFVPGAPLQPLPKGVVTGANACSCGALFSSGSVVSTSTAEDGSFTLQNAPVGNVPLVLQVGKWRRLVHVNTTACTDNVQPDKSLTLPSTVPTGDTDDNIPDIAVSTGAADTLECLLLRVGLPASEYVAGVGTAGGGHVHIFSGGADPDTFDPVGITEDPPMSGAPHSYTDLWMTQAQLMPYDVVLLSCESGETYNANPPALESYLNAGGRVFASHYHYSWFSGPIASGQGYSAPADWGNHLATWMTDDGTLDDGNAVGGIIDTTLNGSSTAFPKGVSLQKFLTNTNSLGQSGVASGELSIFSPRYDAVVSAVDTPSQGWITSDASAAVAGSTMYFSFDTPVTNAPIIEGTPTYCGRAVFSGLHVDGDPGTSDSNPPPDGCDNTDLSPQEKALEFMLFDLSSCVIPDTVAPPPGVPIQ